MQGSENDTMLRSVFFYMCTIQLLKFIIFEHHNEKTCTSEYVYVTLPQSVVPDLLEDQLYSKALWFLT